MAEEKQSLEERGFSAEEQLSDGDLKGQSEPQDKTEMQSDETSKDAAPDKKYIFRMTKSDGSPEKQWALSPGLFKFGIFSMVFGSLVLIGTLGFTVYSAMNFRLNQTAVSEMERATAIQQEQLLSLSKKASKLSEQLQNLTQIKQKI